MRPWLALLAALLLPPAASPRGTQDPPYERLGHALLEATASDQPPKPSAEETLLARLEPLFARLDLGAVELWLPRRVMSPEGALEDARPPVEWRAIADGLLGLERRWCEELDELGDGQGTGPALEALTTWARRAASKGWPAPGAEQEGAAATVRTALLGRADALPLVLLVAPERAHFLTLVGAGGLFAPNSRAVLWAGSTRRSIQIALSPSVAVLALCWGPVHDTDSAYLGLQVDGPILRQHVVHGTSHLLANRLAPSAPSWLHEGLAIADTVALCGADETLCSGYSGRPPTVFEGWQDVPAAFLIYARLESSPYRSGDSADLFTDELRKAHDKDGWKIIDLDRGRLGMHVRGPFLDLTARVPDEARLGPHGLKEGFAEFFRAYCGAFVGWLGTQELDGTTLRCRMLQTLRERARDWLEGSATVPRLGEILHKLTGLTLGETLDAETDLEGRFQAWLVRRR